MFNFYIKSTDKAKLKFRHCYCEDIKNNYTVTLQYPKSRNPKLDLITNSSSITLILNQTAQFLLEEK